MLIAGTRPEAIKRAPGDTTSAMAGIIPLVKPSLVLALALVVEDDRIDAGAALREALGFSQVCTKDLGVVFPLARLLEFGVERLTMLVAMLLAPGGTGVANS